MMQALAFLFALAAIVATGLPLIRTDLWWVRACDYPKPQMLLICLIALAIWLFVVSAASSFFIPVALLLVLATLWNAFLILPFTRLYPKQVAQASRMEREHCIRVLISNVLMENRDFDAVRRMIRAQDPDIVFLAETDQDWVDALEDVASEFPHVTVQPQDNHYGLMFMTRLAVDSVDLRWLVKDDTPSILARLRAGDGRGFVFYGLHPEPPLVGQDSDARDAELMLVAREMKDLDLPAIVAGDLNDVAWSSTTRLFRRTSGALDPRIGRGLYSSFHADYWFARWPLDHLFHTEEFELGELGLLPSVGSDHFPVFGNLCLALGPNDNDAPEPELDGDAEEVEEIIENGRKNHS